MDLRVTLEERIFVPNGMDLQECNLMEVHLVFLVGNLYADHLDIAVNLQVTFEERILTRMEWISRNASWDASGIIEFLSTATYSRPQPGRS